MHWSADMAMKLLRQRHACELLGPSSSNGSKGCNGDNGGDCSGGSSGGNLQCPWIESLPAEITTPLEFSKVEVAAAGCSDAIAEVEGMKECIASCFDVSLCFGRGAVAAWRGVAIGCSRGGG